MAILYPGRFQPFHSGHELVSRRIYDIHGELPVFAVIRGAKTPPERAPFSYWTIKTCILRVFPSSLVIECSDGYLPKIVGRLSVMGITVTHAYIGGDRAEDYSHHFPDGKVKIECVPRFEGPWGDGRSVSGTIVRDIIMRDDYDGWLDTVPKEMWNCYLSMRKEMLEAFEI